MNIFTKASFWENVKDTIAVFGPTTELVAITKDWPHEAQSTIAVLSLVGYVASHIIKIWFKDADNDGVIDIVEDEKKNS